jgi:tetratricopeptide (TPR) repeat protein
MKRWQETLVFGVCIVAFLIPISIVQSAIDKDDMGVVFLRWIDNQEAYQGLVLQSIIAGADSRYPEELALFDNVETTGERLNPDFRNLSVRSKWRVLHNPDFQPLRDRFLQLVKESKITLTEGEIEWANPEVSANVGVLVLGFRKLVADLLWLKVDEYWHLGLPQRMLPMMETVVALDPHFIVAYSLGAWHLAYNVSLMVHSAEEKQHYIDQGIALLAKGIKSNPRSSDLYAELGFTIYFRKLNDWEKAAYYLREAIKYEHEPWVERVYALSLERLGEEREALAILEDYGRRHPTFVAQRTSVERLRRKVEARRLEKEGKLKEALAIWQFLKDDDSTDVIAPREYLRLLALTSHANALPKQAQPTVGTQ